MIKLSKSDFHSHILKRMRERGISIEEIEKTLNEGKYAEDAKKETNGKKYVFNFGKEREGIFFKQKEVTVYYKRKENKIILLTVLARYGDKFEI